MNDAPETPDGFAAAAIELSERHTVGGRGPALLPAWKDLQAVKGWLREARAVCAKAPPHLVKAAEWLLDNDRQVERTIRQVATDLPPAFYRKLTRLEGPEHRGIPRVYAIAHAMLRSSHLQVSLAGSISFVQAYQERAGLTIAELWAMPTMLRLACIELLLASFERLAPELKAPFALSELALAPLALESGEGVARSIANLAVLSTIPWKDFFDRTSQVEAILRADPAGVYARKDFASRDLYRKAVENLALGSGRSEPEVAAIVVKRAANERGGLPEGLVGYWLGGAGRDRLEADLGFRPSTDERWRRAALSHPGAFYATLYGAATLFAIATTLWLVVAAGASLAALIVGVLVAIIPATVAAASLVQWIVPLAVPPRMLAKLDFEAGIPDDCVTAVVVPVLVSRPQDVAPIIERLELHRLANPAGTIRFVLLSDVPDAPTATTENDQPVIAALKAGIEDLNLRYDKPGPFHLLHRSRRFSPAEGVFIGWERKRGKIEQFNDLVATGDVSAFSLAVGDLPALRAVRFVVTVDADTVLPPGSVARLVGTIADPMNAPVYDAASGRVVSGYTIVQPRIEISPEGAGRSLFADIYSGDTAVDIYSRAVSNVYQDLFGEGIFAGKGVYDLASFRRSCGGVSEGTILSHDLLEGIRGRAALATDIVLYENFPASYIEHVRRWHRWIRGDWQLLPWLIGRGPRSLKNDRWRPSGLDRWKMVDNLRRSLVPPATMLFLAVGWLALPVNPWAWTAFGIGALGVQLLTGLVATLAKGGSVRGALVALGMEARRWIVGLVFLANDAAVACDAIARTLWRVFVSGQHLLQWMPASEVAAEVARGSPAVDAWRRMAAAPMVASVLAALIIALRPQALLSAAPLLAAWFASPHVAVFLSRPRHTVVEALVAADRAFLRRIARRTWLFFETFVGPEDNWLPPDNYHEVPRREVDHRTSPTNIGLMFVSSLAAWDLGYVGVLDLATRVRSGLDALDRMAKYQGHLFNWYDSRSLAALEPRYVSTVDSGNLAASLVLLRQACSEITATSVMRAVRWDGLADTLGELQQAVAPLHATAADELVAMIARRIAAVRDDPRSWRRSVVALSDENYPALQQAVAAAVVADRKMRPAALQDIQIWLERLNHHLVAVRRTFDVLLPWVAFLEEPADGCTALAARLDSVLGFDQPLRSSANAAAQISPGETPSSEEATRWIDGLRKAIDAGLRAQRDLVVMVEQDGSRADAMAFAMDFRFLFDREQRLFHIGYNASAQRIDPNHYDLLASEARIASYFAIAKGDVPNEHWFHLNRPVLRLAGGLALASWNGSMFEYLMPALFLPSLPDTLLGRSERAAVDASQEYGAIRGVPWGFSESAFAAVDAEGHYRYRAFGVPELGLRRDLSRDLVVAPYATALALAVRPAAAMRNLHEMDGLGLFGRYGMIEAADFTPRRVPAGVRCAQVSTVMAHHQGMSLAAIDNALTGDALVRRFMADSRMRSVELLLYERVPWEAPMESVRRAEDAPPAIRKPPIALPPWRPLPTAGYPQVQSFGNGSMSTWISDAGGGGIAWRGQSLTRWVPDTTRDADGVWIYITDRDSGASWSPTRLPAGGAGGGEVVFHPHVAEFVRREGGIAMRLEVGVAPHDDVDIRRVTVTNESDRPRRLRITSYGEVVLAPPRQDERHPAFSKLFVSSEALPHLNALLFQRRPRDPREQPPVMLHRVIGDDRGVMVSGFETDRRAFLGRNGSLRAPRGVTEGVTSASGWTLDPVMALDVALDVKPGEQRQLAFLTLAAGTRESVLDLAARYATLPALDWAFTDAVAESAHEAQQLDLPREAAGDLQRLASLLRYPHQALRGAPAAIAANRLGQPGLWGIGLSGDFPILLLRVGDAKDTRVLQILIRAHAYWRKRGLSVDLVVLRMGASAYEEPMRERVAALLQEADAQLQFGGRAGIHLLFADQAGSDQLRLLESVAYVVLEEGRTIADQLAGAQPPLRPLPRFEPPQVPDRIETPRVARPQRLRFDNDIGGFSEDGREYVIHWTDSRRPPAPWCNVIANEAFGTIVSEAGIGFTWAINSGENRLTPWSNDSVADPPGEALYLRDEETAEVWTPTPEPAGGGLAVEVRHGAGYTTWRRQSHGLEQTLKVFVPPDEPVKVARLTLRNLEPRNRRLTATYYAEWLLGALKSMSQPHVVAEFESGWPALIARNPWNPDFADRVAFLVSNRPIHDFATDRQEFLGREGNVRLPRALTRWGLGRNVRPGSDACAAYQVHVDLAAGATTEIVFVLGQGRDRAHAEELARRWQDATVVDAAEKATAAFWDRMVGPVTVRSPDPAFDTMVNRWLLYQATASRLFARAGFQQANGAFGFRDQLQDVLAILWSDPLRARAHILTCAARQFEQGDVLHWWHPPANQGVRTRCSDDLLWLPYAVTAYVQATGDTGVLAEEVPFLTGRELAPEEHDRYARFDVSNERGTLLEHCRRALERGVTRGPHGLPLMGAGDWNDGMDRVGAKGRGESVWLAWFVIATLDRFIELAEGIGRADLAERWRPRVAELRRAVEAAAWDGDWYVRAFDDDGRAWGSKTAEECKIDSIAQSWSVIAGTTETGRSAAAVYAAFRELNRGEGILRLLWPPFTDTARDPGYIKAYPPGVRENGGQYAHAAAWLGFAFAELGDGNTAYQVFKTVNPIERTRTRDDAEYYRVEPYIMAADVDGAAPRVGQGGWTWYTGSAAWTWRFAVEGILGLKLRNGELTVEPCLPPDWRSFEAEVRGPQGTLLVQVDNPSGIPWGRAEITVDDAPLREGSAVAFPTDGSVRRVTVRPRSLAVGAE